MKFNLLRIVYLLANSFFMILPSQTQHEYYHQLSSFRIDHTFCIKLKNFYFSSHDDRYMEFYSLIYSIKFVHPFYGIVGTYNFGPFVLVFLKSFIEFIPLPNYPNVSDLLATLVTARVDGVQFPASPFCILKLTCSSNYYHNPDIQACRSSNPKVQLMVCTPAARVQFPVGAIFNNFLFLNRFCKAAIWGRAPFFNSNRGSNSRSLTHKRYAIYAAYQSLRTLVTRLLHIFCKAPHWISSNVQL